MDIVVENWKTEKTELFLGEKKEIDENENTEFSEKYMNTISSNVLAVENFIKENSMVSDCGDLLKKMNAMFEQWYQGIATHQSFLHLHFKEYGNFNYMDKYDATESSLIWGVKVDCVSPKYLLCAIIINPFLEKHEYELLVQTYESLKKEYDQAYQIDYNDNKTKITPLSSSIENDICGVLDLNHNLLLHFIRNLESDLEEDLSRENEALVPFIDGMDEIIKRIIGFGNTNFYPSQGWDIFYCCCTIFIYMQKSLYPAIRERAHQVLKVMEYLHFNPATAEKWCEEREDFMWYDPLNTKNHKRRHMKISILPAHAVLQRGFFEKNNKLLDFAFNALRVKIDTQHLFNGCLVSSLAEPRKGSIFLSKTSRKNNKKGGWDSSFSTLCMKKAKEGCCTYNESNNDAKNNKKDLTETTLSMILEDDFFEFLYNVKQEGVAISSQPEKVVEWFIRQGINNDAVARISYIRSYYPQKDQTDRNFRVSFSEIISGWKLYNDNDDDPDVFAEEENNFELSKQKCLDLLSSTRFFS